VASIGFVIIGYAVGPAQLLAGYVIVGIGWASLANLPYKIILEGVEETQIDTVLAHFNLTVVLPQIGLALALAWLFAHIIAREAIMIGAVAMGAAGLCALLSSLIQARRN